MRKASHYILYLIFLPVSFLTTALHAQTPDINGIVYIKQGGAGTGSGDSWGNATSDLQAAINAAGVTQVWVAAGNYMPGTNASFFMKNGVAILGGFPNTGAPDIGLRDWQTNKTTLKGNGKRVFNNQSLNFTAVLDGFIITEGFYPSNAGAGMLNNAASPTLRNLKITGNTTTSVGGGMYNDNSSAPILTNVEITGNTANGGGGMHNANGSSPTLTNVQITGNTATNSDGGGIYNDASSSPVLTNVQISDNTAARDGGGLYNNASSATLINVQVTGNTAARDGGGLYNNNYFASSSLTLTNVTITGNKATGTSGRGGGIYNYWSNLSFTNVLIAGNTAVASGGGVYDDYKGNSVFTNVTLANNGTNGIYANGNLLSLNNSIIWGAISGSKYTTTNCLVEGGSSTANGNVDATGFTNAVIFVDPSTGDYTLKIGSPAVNKGNNSLFAGLASETKDLAGSPRLFGSTIDLGAYEYQGIDALPVSFGSLGAVIQNGQLLVNWTTETETGNDHFLIQASQDGIHFATIQTVQSKAVDGDSNTSLEYSSAIPFTGLSLGIGFLALGLMANRRHKPAFAIIAILLCALFFSCDKKDLLENSEDGKLFIRIVQVDKDGKERVSKVVQAVRE
ncbi:right-handed parallel beta-helix repeat-containing protein [Niabella hirudinis]|uniref:right-handed parallel beta-helix repeat-containing protein n=1 Tax=Niabella hirudinis TaxID=1285929 RepID=UPI003EB77990